MLFGFSSLQGVLSFLYKVAYGRQNNDLPVISTSQSLEFVNMLLYMTKRILYIWLN